MQTKMWQFYMKKEEISSSKKKINKIKYSKKWGLYLCALQLLLDCTSKKSET